MNLNMDTIILLSAAGGAALLLIIFIIISIVNCVKLSKISRNCKNGNLGETIENYYNKIGLMASDIKNMSARFSVYEEQLKICYKRSAVVHYNAFGDISGNLSFSMAVLDDNLDGFIMTSLYGHDSSSIYMRDIREGKASVAISDEEKYVLEQAAL
jgi:hypothetical protein